MSFHLSSLDLQLGALPLVPLALLAIVVALVAWKPRAWPALVALILAAFFFLIAATEAVLSVGAIALHDAAFSAVLASLAGVRWPRAGNVAAFAGILAAGLSACLPAPSHTAFSTTFGEHPGHEDANASMPVNLTISGDASMPLTIATGLLAPAIVYWTRRRRGTTIDRSP